MYLSSKGRTVTLKYRKQKGTTLTKWPQPVSTAVSHTDIVNMTVLCSCEEHRTSIQSWVSTSQTPNQEPVDQRTDRNCHGRERQEEMNYFRLQKFEEIELDAMHVAGHGPGTEKRACMENGWNLSKIISLVNSTVPLFISWLWQLVLRLRKLWTLGEGGEEYMEIVLFLQCLKFKIRSK